MKTILWMIFALFCPNCAAVQEVCESELDIIVRAAVRNKCTGKENFRILLAIRLTENGGKGLLQERELQTSANLVQYNKTKGFSWIKHVPNVATLSQKQSFIKAEAIVRTVQNSNTRSGRAKIKTLYLPVEKNIMQQIESLFLKVNEKNTKNIVNLIWNVLVSNGSNMGQEYMPTRNEGIESSNKPYICFSNNIEAGDVKFADTTKTSRGFNGTIETLPKKNLIASLCASQLKTSRQLLKKLKNVNCCVLIATEISTIRILTKQASCCQKKLLLNVFKNNVSYTAFYEAGGPGKEFGIKHPRAWGTDLDTQAGWAAATIVKNRQRWLRAGKPCDFINFLACRWCPPSADRVGHKNWKKNVRYFVSKGD